MENKGKHIKCKVCLDKVFYPKGGNVTAGTWSSFSCQVLCVLKGEPKVNKKYHTISCSGSNVPNLYNGEVYILNAVEEETEKYGVQYKIYDMHTDYKLDDPQDQKTFLRQILSDAEITALYEYDPNPFKLLEDGDIGKLMKVRGIGPAKAQKLVDKFLDNIDNSEAYVVLEKYGMTKHTMDALIKQFGVGLLVDKLDKDPYFLLYQVKGFGWNKTDKIAIAGGILPTDVRRVKAFVVYVLNERSEEGNTYIETNHLIELMRENLNGTPDEIIREGLYSLSESGIIWWDEKKTKIGLINNYILEENIAKELLRLQNATPTSEITTRSLDDVLPAIEAKNGWEFTDEQRQAVIDTLNSNVSIITGAAGCGKTTVVSAILECCEGAEYAQTALAGRAAARMSEITGSEGYTIHRLLGYGQNRNPNSRSVFMYNRDCQLPYNMIIVDEISMVGGEIFYNLISAVQSGAKLILLGDSSQLESIGYLNIFRDMMDSGVIATSRLTKIHRQAAKSAIITSSMHVRNQMQLFPKNYVGREVRGELQDLEVDIYEDSALTQRKVIRHFTELLEKGIDINDIQVIVPMKTRGDICTFALNPSLQNIANPNTFDFIPVKKKLDGKEVEYKIGINDKVINVKNHYIDTFDKEGVKTPVYNGNMGVVKRIEEKFIFIDFFQWGVIMFPRSSVKDLELAYAITGHKLQGSESPYTIIGIDMSAYMMLTKEWLYTAITRARKYCILCAQNGAVATAINTSRVPYKQTLLSQLLNGTKFFDSSTLKMDYTELLTQQEDLGA